MSPVDPAILTGVVAATGLGLVGLQYALGRRDSRIPRVEVDASLGELSQSLAELRSAVQELTHLSDVVGAIGIDTLPVGGSVKDATARHPLSDLRDRDPDWYARVGDAWREVTAPEQTLKRRDGVDISVYLRSLKSLAKDPNSLAAC